MSTAARAPRKPQDRKPKASAAFEFEAGGKTYTLPKVNEDIMSRVEGGIVENALFAEDPQAEVKLAFAMLRAVEGHDEAVAALRKLPFPEMTRIAAEWSTSSGGDLGESAG